MPVYDFKCKNESCGKTEERLVPSSTVESQVCSCGSPMERQFTVGKMMFLFNFMADDA